MFFQQTFLRDFFRRKFFAGRFSPDIFSMQVFEIFKMLQQKIITQPIFELQQLFSTFWKWQTKTNNFYFIQICELSTFKGRNLVIQFLGLCQANIGFLWFRAVLVIPHDKRICSTHISSQIFFTILKEPGAVEWYMAYIFYQAKGVGKCSGLT